MLFSNPWINVHIAAMLVAIPVGAAMFAMRKGTPNHRKLGYVFFAAMLIGNFSVMPVEANIFRLGDSGFGFFHVLALLSLFSLAMGARALMRWKRTREPDAMRSHQVNLGYAYLGMIMALASQILVNRRHGIADYVTAENYLTLFAIINITLYVGGSIWIFRAFRGGKALPLPSAAQ
jgi:uncharacterized membrane protein